MASSPITQFPPPTRAGALVNAALADGGRAVRGRRRVGLLVLTVALGAGAGIAIAAFAPPADRTFVAVQGTTQLVISVLLPLVGILLARDARDRRATTILPTAVASAAIAVRVSVAGLLAAVVATSAAAGTTPDRWHGAASLVAGGVLVQIGCVLVGVGRGLLIQRPWLAFVASAALPLGLYAALDVVAPLHAAREWLTPYASAQHLLSGTTTPIAWAQAVVVLLLWAVGLPVLGLAVARRRHARRD